MNAYIQERTKERFKGNNQGSGKSYEAMHIYGLLFAKCSSKSYEAMQGRIEFSFGAGEESTGRSITELQHLFLSLML